MKFTHSLKIYRAIDKQLNWRRNPVKKTRMYILPAMTMRVYVRDTLFVVSFLNSTSCPFFLVLLCKDCRSIKSNWTLEVFVKLADHVIIAHVPTGLPKRRGHTCYTLVRHIFPGDPNRRDDWPKLTSRKSNKGRRCIGGKFHRLKGGGLKLGERTKVVLSNASSQVQSHLTHSVLERKRVVCMMNFSFVVSRPMSWEKKKVERLNMVCWLLLWINMARRLRNKMTYELMSATQAMRLYWCLTICVWTVQKKTMIGRMLVFALKLQFMSDSNATDRNSFAANMTWERLWI